MGANPDGVWFNQRIPAFGLRAWLRGGCVSLEAVAQFGYDVLLMSKDLRLALNYRPALWAFCCSDQVP